MLMGLVSNIIGKPVTNDNLARRDEKTELMENIKRAHEEWMAARSYFESVTDPYLIDYAVLAVEAAEKKYTYLMNKAREYDLKGDINYHQF